MWVWIFESWVFAVVCILDGVPFFLLKQKWVSLAHPEPSLWRCEGTPRSAPLGGEGLAVLLDFDGHHPANLAQVDCWGWQVWQVRSPHPTLNFNSFISFMARSFGSQKCSVPRMLSNCFRLNLPWWQSNRTAKEFYRGNFVLAAQGGDMWSICFPLILLFSRIISHIFCVCSFRHQAPMHKCHFLDVILMLWFCELFMSHFDFWFWSLLWRLLLWLVQVTSASHQYRLHDHNNFDIQWWHKEGCRCECPSVHQPAICFASSFSAEFPNHFFEKKKKKLLFFVNQIGLLFFSLEICAFAHFFVECSKYIFVYFFGFSRLHHIGLSFLRLCAFNSNQFYKISGPFLQVFISCLFSAFQLFYIYLTLLPNTVALILGGFSAYGYSSPPLGWGWKWLKIGWVCVFKIGIWSHILHLFSAVCFLSVP